MADQGKVKVDANVSLGSLWFFAWLFTVGFTRLGFWQGVFAVVLWPYYLGDHFADRIEAPPDPPQSTISES